MIKIIDDVQVINRIANLPEVLPFIGPDLVSIDLSDTLNYPSRYLFLTNEEQTAISLWDMATPGVWEGHTMFSKECRGKEAVKTGREMIDYLHEIRPVILIWGQTPVGNKPANWFNAALGFKHCGVIEHHVMGLENLWFYSRYMNPESVMIPHQDTISELYSREATNA